MKSMTSLISEWFISAYYTVGIFISFYIYFNVHIRAINAM